MDAFKLSNEIQNQLILEVDEKGLPLEEVVQEWIDNNESTWKPWIDVAVM